MPVGASPGQNPNPAPARAGLAAVRSSAPAGVSRATSIGPVRFDPLASTGPGARDPAHAGPDAAKMSRQMDRATSWGPVAGRSVDCNLGVRPVVTSAQAAPGTNPLPTGHVGQMTAAAVASGTVLHGGIRTEPAAAAAAGQREAQQTGGNPAKGLAASAGSYFGGDGDSYFASSFADDMTSSVY